MVAGRFLDPKNDFCFKQIFGTEKNQDILIHFLNDILGYKGEDVVTEVEFIPTSQDTDIAIYRQSIVDVMCKNQHGEKFIVEMQIGKHDGFIKRAQHYAAKAYSKQVLKEDKEHKKMAVYAKLKGVIFLAIADFVMFEEKKAWKSEHRLLDTTTYENDLEDFHFVFIELSKYNKSLAESKTIQEKWAYFFKHAKESTLPEMEHLIGKDKIIKRAFEAIDQASWSEEELNTYDHITKTRLDNLAVEIQQLKDAEAKGMEQGIEKGMEQGMEKGIEKGMEQGIEKGIEKGMEQGIEKGIEQTAIKMLLKNKPVEEIIEFTDLTFEQIEKLKDKL